MKKILTFGLLLAPTMAGAQGLDDWGYNDFSNTNIALGSRPLRDTIGGVVNIILGFLGILTTLIILLGGFKWMTSGGNEELISKAKKRLIGAIIGLAIVLGAWIISNTLMLLIQGEPIVDGNLWEPTI